MKQYNRKGFATTLALIAILPLIGLAVMLLASGSSTMIHQATNDSLQAKVRNISVSATTWAMQNRSRLFNTDQSIELDLKSMDINNATCKITPAVEDDGTIKCSIEVNVSEKTQSRTHDFTFMLAKEDTQ